MDVVEVTVDGQQPKVFTLSDDGTTLVVSLSTEELEDGIHSLSIPRGLQSVDGLRTVAEFRSIFTIARKQSAFSDPEASMMTGLICQNFTKLCHKAPGANWLRIRVVGCDWSEWYPYEDESRWTTFPGVAVLVQYHAEGSTAYVVSDCRTHDGSSCRSSWHTEMWFRPEDWRSVNVSNEGQMLLVRPFTWAANITFSGLRKGKIAISPSSWGKSYGIQPQRSMYYALPNFDPRKPDFQSNNTLSGHEASRLWMQKRGLWGSHEGIASGAGWAAGIPFNSECTATPNDCAVDPSPEGWQAHPLNGSQDLDWCRSVYSDGCWEFRPHSWYADMSGCGWDTNDSKCCKRKLKPSCCATEVTCCILFDDLLLNYSITPNLEACAGGVPTYWPDWCIPPIIPVTLSHEAATYALVLALLAFCFPFLAAAIAVRTQTVILSVQAALGPYHIDGADAYPEPGESLPQLVLCASIEHIVEVQDKVAVKVVAGGLGKVAGLLLHLHPGPFISVHPCMCNKDYSFSDFWGMITIKIDQEEFNCAVHTYSMQTSDGPPVTFYFVDHPVFRDRPDGI
jgi:hypothetical protein